ASPGAIAGDGLASGTAPSAPIDRALQQWIARNRGAAVAVLVQRSSDRAAIEAVRAAGGTVRRQLQTAHVLVASVPASAVPALAREPGVLRVSYDARVLMQGATDWGDRPLASIYPEVVGAPTLWAAARPILGTGVTVAVLDSGLHEHEDYLDAN